jgi:hypothetical protein
MEEALHSLPQPFSPLTTPTPHIALDLNDPTREQTIRAARCVEYQNSAINPYKLCGFSLHQEGVA